LSESTISKALRDSAEISSATKKRVNAYARKVNFRINHNASNLRRQRSSRLIGVIIPDLASEFLSQAVSGINSILDRNDCFTIISETKNSHLKEAKLVSHLVNRSVDGLIISASGGNLNNSHLKELHNRGMPIVFFNNVLADVSTFKVVSNNYDCMFNAVNTLIGKGYKQIAYLSGAEHLSANNERLAGYKAALAANSIPLNAEKVLVHSHRTKASDFEQQIIELLSYGKIPDALIIATDMISPIVLKVLSKVNLAGHPLKIVCVSNSDTADLSDESVSYFRQPAYEMGKMAAELLMKLISEGPPQKYKTVVIKSQVNWKA
jgi:LacI family transcriptional regulator